jgi:hypothetical protein
MKKLVLAATLAAAVSATACTTSSGNGNGDVTVTANWSFKHIADGGARSCPVGFDTATVFAVPYDTLTAELNGNEIPTDLFNCSAGRGTILVPDGQYLISVRIENHAGTTTYADSEQVFIDTAVDGSFAVEILDDGGYLTFRWTLHDAVTRSRLTCAEAGVTSNGAVESIATRANSSGFMLTDQFTCEDHYGTTDGLPAGNYTVALEAQNNDIQLGDAVTLPQTPVGPQNDVTDLGHVQIPID